MVGKVVAQIRYMTDDELAEEGWAGRVTVMEFTDGSVVYAASDGEGNDGGVLLARTADGTTEYVVPSSRQVREGLRA